MFSEEAGAFQNVIELADIKIDTTGGKVIKSGEEIFLSALEYRLLLILLQIKALFYREINCLKKFGTHQGNL